MVRNEGELFDYICNVFALWCQGQSVHMVKMISGKMITRLWLCSRAGKTFSWHVHLSYMYISVDYICECYSRQKAWRGYLLMMRNERVVGLIWRSWEINRQNCGLFFCRLILCQNTRVGSCSAIVYPTISWSRESVGLQWIVEVRSPNLHQTLQIRLMCFNGCFELCWCADI